MKVDNLIHKGDNSSESNPKHQHHQTDATKIVIHNNQSIAFSDIPVIDYEQFFDTMVYLLEDQDCHCVSYYGFEYKGKLKMIACVADDSSAQIIVLSYELEKNDNNRIDSLCTKFLSMHIFEREIYENLGIDFFGHPWLKPVRYAFDRVDKNKTLRNYPFFKIEGEELHEVGVGPIHAGVIEPGHFRFICNGEDVLHLEIQLGYQHRGIEYLYLQKKKLIQRNVLSESIAGDTVVAHSLAFVQNIEAMCKIEVDEQVQIQRAIALELERIAIHIGDLSAMCVDVAYQLGASVFGVIRTPIINFFQFWCGNRFAKGLIRVGHNPYPFSQELKDRMIKMWADVDLRYNEMADAMFALPSIQSRFEKTGETTLEQAKLIGAVGMPARITGLKRDIRNSHPYGFYKEKPIETSMCKTGDVWARGWLRHLEILTSITYIKELLGLLDLSEESKAKQMKILGDENFTKNTAIKLPADCFSISLVESWRGETCHCAITDGNGDLMHYKVKDPSMHNWLALALSVRDNEISDFPICNKSYDLSYCGHDL